MGVVGAGEPAQCGCAGVLERLWAALERGWVDAGEVVDDDDLASRRAAALERFVAGQSRPAGAMRKVVVEHALVGAQGREAGSITDATVGVEAAVDYDRG